MLHDSNYVGPAIARLRTERRWTQERVATELRKRGIKLSPQILSNIECRRRVVTDKQVYHLARLFGVTVESLYPRTANRRN